MLSVLVCNPKGGCGKTTIATNLAAAFAHMGFVTALADCDRQKSACRWVARRPTGVPDVTGLDWSKEVTGLPDGIERLVIDAPAAIRRRDVRELIAKVDVLLVPVLPSLFDELTTGKFLARIDRLKPIRKGRRAVGLIANRVKPRTAALARLENFLAAAPHPTITQVRDSQAYPAAAEKGFAIFDAMTRKTAPLIEEWQPLLRFLTAEARGR
jgi:chromosome partitioning protein